MPIHSCLEDFLAYSSSERTQLGLVFFMRGSPPAQSLSWRRPPQAQTSSGAVSLRCSLLRRRHPQAQSSSGADIFRRSLPQTQSSPAQPSPGIVFFSLPEWTRGINDPEAHLSTPRRRHLLFAQMDKRDQQP